MTIFSSSTSKKNYWLTTTSPISDARPIAKTPAESYLWIPASNDIKSNIVKTVTTNTGNPVMKTSGVTPGWWSEELTEEDIAISLMSNEEVMAEIIAMAGSWENRPESVKEVMDVHNGWGDQLNKIYGEEGNNS